MKSEITFKNFADDHAVMHGYQTRYGAKRGRAPMYPFASLKNRGDAFIIDVPGAAALDEVQARLSGACSYQKKLNSKAIFATRRLPGLKIAVVRMHR